MKATDAMGRDWFNKGIPARTTKGTPTGDYIFNRMPPGQNIENQETADISSMEMKRVTPAGYPGSGGF